MPLAVAAPHPAACTPRPPAPQVGKQSKAAMSMCLWVRAMDTYAAVFKLVEPKRLALAAAQVRACAFPEAPGEGGAGGAWGT